jgi:hypothetical protein
MSVPLAVKTVVKPPPKGERAGFDWALAVVSEVTTHAPPFTDVPAKATEVVPPVSAMVPLQLDASPFAPSLAGASWGASAVFASRPPSGRPASFAASTFPPSCEASGGLSITVSSAASITGPCVCVALAEEHATPSAGRTRKAWRGSMGALL